MTDNTTVAIEEEYRGQLRELESLYNASAKEVVQWLIDEEYEYQEDARAALLNESDSS